MTDVFYSGIKPNVFPHEREADSVDHARELCVTPHFWWINHLSDYSKFNFNFNPQRGSQALQRHTWPSQHQKDSGTYFIPKQGYKDTNYRIDYIIPRIKAEWGDDRDFDFTWHPDPTDPPLIYQFGTQHQKTGGPRYIVDGATDVKYVDSPKEQKTSVDDCWVILENVDHESFDWTWHPDDTDPPFIYVFGNQWFVSEVMPTVEYHVPGATDKKYINDRVANLVVDMSNWVIPNGLDVDKFDFSWKPPAYPPFIYQFGTQHQKTGGPRYVIPGATEIKYIESPSAIKTNRDSYWIVPEELVVESFDWTWHPDDTEPPFIYQFNTQHQATGGPRYVMPDAIEVKYVTQPDIKVHHTNVTICEIDHIDGNENKVPNATKIVRYFDNYLSILKRIAKNVDTKFVWVCSSVCNYTNFDFTWHPVAWQETMLHVFPSDDEKFGDTFYMNVEHFLETIGDFPSLEDYDLNFTDIPVARRPIPVITHAYDTQVEAIQANDWQGPLALFTVGGAVAEMPVVPLWKLQTKTVVPLSKGASQVIVPATVKSYIKKQVYDYPFIDRTQAHLGYDKPLDIVFIDNGETNAEFNYLHLKEQVTTNKLHRSSGVNGRAAAYKAAAELSTTPWFFAVFAKLHVTHDFNWSWQPDRLQEPKHYIFHAYNTVNKLVYGHQAMIAYNKKLVLSNPGEGLDFTLDSAHEVVPMMSGTAEYADTPWSAWRTAFRECIKLKCNEDSESKYRLEQWLTVNTGVTFGEYSIYGAEDAVEYYDSVKGNIAELKKSYEWNWLASYVLLKRNLILNQ